MKLRHDLKHFQQFPPSFPQIQHNRPGTAFPESRAADLRRKTGAQMLAARCGGGGEERKREETTL